MRCVQRDTPPGHVDTRRVQELRADQLRPFDSHPRERPSGRDLNRVILGRDRPIRPPRETPVVAPPIGKTDANFDDQTTAPYLETIAYNLVKHLAESAAAVPPQPSLPVLG